MYYGESLEEGAYRIQMRETGKNFKEMKVVGFANYRFEDAPDSRARHTPTLLCLVGVKEIFVPKDSRGAVDHRWGYELPSRLVAENILFAPM